MKTIEVSGTWDKMGRDIISFIEDQAHKVNIVREEQQCSGFSREPRFEDAPAIEDPYMTIYAEQNVRNGLVSWSKIMAGLNELFDSVCDIDSGVSIIPVVKDWSIYHVEYRMMINIEWEIADE